MYSIDEIAIPSMIIVLPLIALLFRKRGFCYIFFCCIFAIYLLFAIELVFFPINIGRVYESEQGLDLASHLNLIPFYFGRFGTLQSSLETLLLNIVLTIPFGFGIRFIAPIKPKMILWIAVLVGLITEGGQFLLLFVQPYSMRLVDINDVLMKIGILLFCILLIYNIIYFAFYSYNEYTKGQVLAVKLKRKQTQLQLNALKSQLSPQYLFNSINISDCNSN